MGSTKVLITVKTYPTLSKRYGELVCTAGIKEDGSWVRIYPVPFRRLKEYLRYEKYRWIELPLKRNTNDPRPESYKPTDLNKINFLNSIGTSNKWQERKDFILKKVKCYDDMDKLTALSKSDGGPSLVLFKPTKIIDFFWENDERTWNKKRLSEVTANLKQGSLFEEEEFIKDFEIAAKLPYKFKYKFTDINGKESNLMIEDWEVGALYWKYHDEKIALQKVREKYFDTFVNKTDIYFYLGTTKRFHSWAKNPFIIIGIFNPPKDKQLNLFT
ncbi:MAG: hypothetical protein PHQ00_02710 [Phycisphaerae bacterium]|nr:hypothetical protein [Phycisphaerae bacterium]